jgi:16S rRNA (uracil1498-N3)-methyltransferase
VNLLLLEPGERFLARADARARHITRILRLRSGDKLRAGEVGGPTGVARIVNDSDRGIELEFKPEREPPALPPVELLLGHPRPIVLRRLLRDLTAIGPSRIIIAPTELGERSYYEAGLWRDVRTPMLEGASQGATTRLPQLVRAGSLAEAVKLLNAQTDRRFVLHPESDVGLLTAVRSASIRRWRAVAIGSERGWTDAELDSLTGAGFTPCSLGGRILRTETAAAIAAWTACSWYDDPS